MTQPISTMRYWFDKAEQYERERDAARVAGLREALTIAESKEYLDDCCVTHIRETLRARIAEAESNPTGVPQ